MFGFLFGLTMGILGSYIYRRFKDALIVWKNKVEAKFEKVLKDGTK